MHKPWVRSPAPHKLGLLVHTSHPSTEEAKGRESLYSEFKAVLNT